MRAVLLCVLVPLAGCAAPAPPPAATGHVVPPSPLTTADPDFVRLNRPMTPAEAKRREMENAADLEARARDGQAEAVCAARAEMAGATYAGRGFGLVGALTAGAEASVAGARVQAACLDAYRRAGVVPAP